MTRAMTRGTGRASGPRSRTVGAVAAGLVGAAVLASCGSDEEALRDAANGKPFDVVVSVRFDRRQRLARTETLRVVVRNRDSRPLPDVSVTLRGLDREARDEGASIGGITDPRRPVWIVESTPTGASTAATRTWARGRLAPGGTRVFRWRLTPTVAGTHVLRWAVAGGVDEAGAVRRGVGSLRVRVGSRVSR